MNSSFGRGGGGFVAHLSRDLRFSVAVAASFAFVGPSLGREAESAKVNTEGLFASAAQAEAQGDVSKSQEVLREIIRIDPENQRARWQLGQIKVENQWVAVEEAQRRASADPLQGEYRERRAAAGGRAPGQLAVAKWARKNGLPDESFYHWTRVFAGDPNNAEALHALDLRWQNGRLMSREQIADNKVQARNAKRAAERWAPKVVGWRRAVSGQDSTARDTAIAEIGAIAEADAIPSIEAATLGRESRDLRSAEDRTKIANAFVGALGNMPGQEATESLARHAVFATDASTRKSAAEKLKPRDQHDYMPMLLSALGMPVEAAYSVTTGPDGSVHYLRSLYREGPDNDWAWDSQHSLIQRDLRDRQMQFDPDTRAVRVGQTGPQRLRGEIIKTARATSYQKKYGKDAATTESHVVEANQAVETMNSRIVPVLAEVTGEKFGDNPKEWWDWWKNKNEYYTADHPVAQIYTSDSDNINYTIPEPEIRPHSCFAKGTLVWTKTGKKAIETIEPGDLVLSQNVDSGELKYKAVMRRTVRPPSPLLKIYAGDEELHATGGHVFWVSGTGWRMAKELGDNAVLHGLSKTLTVRSVKPAENGEAYNLVVADFSTYFVGESGVLAHDITPQRPTQAVLPGILRK